MTITIYHNPRCSKSRQTLQLLKDNSIEPEIIKYLDTPPTEAELREIVKKLGKTVNDIIRKKESLFKELNLGDASTTEDQLFKALAENPKLIERPIVVNGDQARIGRPPESVLEII